jgi:hypothetical protein
MDKTAAYTIKQISQPNDAHARIVFPPRCQGCFALSLSKKKK